MVWVISIAVFLATVVAALLVFLIYSQKEQIKKALKEKRKEERTKLEIELELATPHEPPVYEKYATENTSRHGARILTSKQWQPHEHVLVRLPFKNEPLPAQITYCDALPANTFAVGLKFSSPVHDWLVSDDNMSSDERPYRK
jgi:PilZ domain